ncbi:serine/threonine protein kinase, partial [Phytophthora nicotianae P10297]
AHKSVGGVKDNCGYFPFRHEPQMGKIGRRSKYVDEYAEASQAASLARLRTLVRGGVAFDKEEELRSAAWTGHLAVVRYLTDECGSDVNAANDAGETALMKAASNGMIEVIRFLVNECSADVNATNREGDTALMKAVYSGKIDVVRYLAEECGVDVNATSDDGETAVMKAAEFDRFDILRYLTADCGADVNIASKNGVTVLIQTSGYGRIHVVRYLAEICGADVNAQDKNGETAVIKAAAFGQINVVRYLAEKCNVDVNAGGFCGYTALMLAANNGKMEVVWYLAEQCDADVNVGSDHGATALLMAAEMGKKNVVRYLVERRGADVNAKTNDGYTAVTKASENGQTEIVRYLVIERGADVHIKTKNGDTALRVAVDRGFQDIQQILMPYLQPPPQVIANDSSDDTVIDSRSGLPIISPSEIALIFFSQNGNTGGDFRAKWLDADVSVKLFVPTSSRSAFESEVRLWQQLRHPNVIKMYGACTAGPNLQFFVCEYASQGSLSELTAPDRFTETVMWKWLHEAALGLEYLHERGLIHGDLRCSNILIGSDGMAKLSNFGLSSSMNGVSPRTAAAQRWQAPEVLKGETPSHQSDVYSLGMCILEAATGERPWSMKDEGIVRFSKFRWIPEEINNCYGPYCSLEDSRSLVWRMCCQDPHNRLNLSSVRYELEQLSIKESCDLAQPEHKPSSSFDTYDSGSLNELWHKLLSHMDKCGDIQHHGMLDNLKKICELLQNSTHSSVLFERFHTHLTDFYKMIRMSPEQARIMRLSSTRLTNNSLYAFEWRVNSLMAALGEANAGKKREELWQKQRCEQVEGFVSGLFDIFLVLRDLKSSEERSLFLTNLKTELEDPQGNYTDEQREVLKKTYEQVTNKLECEGGSSLVPKWFIPWYELLVDEWSKLGEGGFGSVFRAKWLDSEVVVKRVILAGSDTKNDMSIPVSDLSLSTLSTSTDPTVSEAETNAIKRAETLKMFQREVVMWFGLSHPHVILLFGACHVGRPFFVCEYATNGTLISYLQRNPDELWTKLHEAALGVQYLHARVIVHGDLKGNNIVIGSDMKAKVTDFGLSSVASSRAQPVISAAWQWLAPECFSSTKAARPTFASDVYSLGMCIVEALRVVEAVKSGEGNQSCLPWRNLDNFAVRYHASKGTLPSQPKICEESQWNLVKRMCSLEPTNRIKISTVVDELARFANMDDDDNQEHDLTPTEHTEQKSIRTVTIQAKKLLRHLRADATQDTDVLLRYMSLWKRLGLVQGQMKSQPEVCRAAFDSLVTDAGSFTMELQNANESLVALAEMTMRYYALDRRLDKLCEAYCIDWKRNDDDIAISRNYRRTSSMPRGRIWR